MAAQFSSGQIVNYPASGPGVSPSHFAGVGRVVDIIQYNDGTGYVYRVSGDRVISTIPQAFKETELTAVF